MEGSKSEICSKSSITLKCCYETDEQIEKNMWSSTYNAERRKNEKDFVIWLRPN